MTKKARKDRQEKSNDNDKRKGKEKDKTKEKRNDSSPWLLLGIQHCIQVRFDGEHHQSRTDRSRTREQTTTVLYNVSPD